MTETIGFIGTGTITAAIVRGLKASAQGQRPVLLSPRSAQLSAELAAGLPGVSVASSNQDVLDRADLVVLAVRPQVAEAVLTDLRFAPEKPVISLIAGLDHDRLRAWTGVARLCRAIPLPFVESRTDAVPVFPPLPEAMQIFGALGQAMPVHDRAAFDAYATLSALMGSYFGIVEVAQDWGKAQGLTEAEARAYLGRMFANLGTVLQGSGLSLADLRHEHSTAGGLNEQAFAEFTKAGGTAALTAALNTVLRRAQG